MLSAKKIKHRYFGTSSELFVESFDLGGEDFITLLGGVKSGKTEFLKCIAGLESPSAGEITVGDRLLKDIKPRDRKIVLTFNGEGYFKWKSVQKNMTYSDKLRKHDKYDSIAKAEILAEKFMFTGILYHPMRMLNNYFKAKVSLARSFMREDAEYFLFDNPLANLRIEEREELFSIFCYNLSMIKGGMVYATDSVKEASILNKLTYFIYNGRIIAQGTVTELESSNLHVVHNAFNNDRYNYFEGAEKNILLALKGMDGVGYIATVPIEKTEIYPKGVESIGARLEGVVIGQPVTAYGKVIELLVGEQRVLAKWCEGVAVGQMVNVCALYDDITALEIIKDSEE